jgi:MscS family membrane protein
MRSWPRVLSVCLIACVLSAVSALAQTPPSGAPAPPSQPEKTKDALGRTTPRGTVLGFVNAAHKGDYQLASQYLNTGLSNLAAEERAEQLFVVLDARLPARLAQVSDAPEGSRSNPLAPDEDFIATIAGADTQLDILLERVERPRVGQIWLFSSKTLDGIPSLYDEVVESRSSLALPRFLTDTRLRGVPVFEWIVILLGFPLLYSAIVLLNRLLTPLARVVSRRLFGDSGFVATDALPRPLRLLLLAITSRWLLSKLTLSLRLRQVFSMVTALLTIVAIAWLLMRLTEELERYWLRRFQPSNTAAVSLMRVFRRGIDTLVVFGALLATLRHFGIDPTPALAGLGVGGIAVALAAQKTLENVIAGASLIFDQAVRVGDTLKMGEIVGTVDHIGLRSTRIRTIDRTIVSVPNSQIASASLETLSARDKFWFHPVVGLRYETTTDQLQLVTGGIRRLLEQHASVSRESVRVRFIRLGASSLDVEVFAYVFATDWTQFLEIQEELLFKVTEIVERAGTSIAFPSRTLYVTSTEREKGQGAREKEASKV